MWLHQPGERLLGKSPSPESAERGVISAVLEVAQNLPALAGALGKVLAEKADTYSLCCCFHIFTKEATVSL